MAIVLGDDALYAFIGGVAPTVAELRERYRRQVVGRSPDGTEIWHNWIVRRRSDDRAIGTVQVTLSIDDRSAELAWVIGVPWQGQGFAREAVDRLVTWLADRGVRDVLAHIHPDHTASAAVAAGAALVPTDVIDDGERVWRSVPVSLRAFRGTTAADDAADDAAE